ncbi:MAG: hypothetical protein RI891_674, partial [Gemmatimonadota bacterium]
MRRRTSWVRMGLLLLVAACEGPTGTGDGDARFDGTWRYEASIAGSTAGVVGQLQIA